MAKPALGRGLSALLGGVPAPKAPARAEMPASETPRGNGGAPPAVATEAPTPGVGSVLNVSIERVHPCPFQPRKQFSQEPLQELADSIRAQGILQPLMVRFRKDGQYEIIAGERRWRAAQQANLKEVPVLIREADDRAVMEIALIENLQRENLNPLEEALGYSELIERFQLRQEDAAAKVGKSRAAVANALRLLKLPASLQEQIRAGTLSAGHAKVILGLPTAILQERAARRVVDRNLSVRQTEELVAHLQKEGVSSTTLEATAPAAKKLDPNMTALENQLRERLGTKVGLRYNKGKGSLEIKFYSDDELQRILEILGVRLD